MSSKIPVHHGESTNPKVTAYPAVSMKRTKFEFKENTVPSQFNFSTKTDPADMHKPQNNVPRKKVPSKVYKGPSARVETELRDQNRLLEACKDDLQKKLSQSEEKVDQLEQQYIDLQGEHNEIQKQLENCLHLLVAGNIDLVEGEKIAEATQQKEEERKDIQNVSQELLEELQKFGQKASEHRAQVQEVHERMRNLREKRKQHLEEREEFSLELEEMEKALESAEQLILEEM